jgi:hypothetical protein
MVKMQDLVKSPLVIITPDAEYDFGKQTRYHEQIDLRMAVTFRATQTFNNSGKPIDSDND